MNQEAHEILNSLDCLQFLSAREYILTKDKRGTLHKRVGSPTHQLLEAYLSKFQFDNFRVSIKFNFLLECLFKKIENTEFIFFSSFSMGSEANFGCFDSAKNSRISSEIHETAKNVENGAGICFFFCRHPFFDAGKIFAEIEPASKKTDAASIFFWTLVNFCWRIFMAVSQIYSPAANCVNLPQILNFHKT